MQKFFQLCDTFLDWMAGMMSTHLAEAGAIEVFDELESTNAAMKARGRAGASHGAALRARVQTAGRGQRAHTWSSPEGGLYLSILIRPEVPRDALPGLPVACALGALRALREAGCPRASLKWPNDIVVGRRKLAGMLTELSSSKEGVFAVYGIGVNMKAPVIDATGPTAAPDPIAATYPGVATGSVAAAAPGATTGSAAGSGTTTSLDSASRPCAQAGPGTMTGPGSATGAIDAAASSATAGPTAAAGLGPAPLAPAGLLEELAAGVQPPSLDCLAELVRTRVLESVDEWMDAYGQSGAYRGLPKPGSRVLGPDTTRWIEDPVRAGAEGPLAPLLAPYNACLAFVGHAVRVFAIDGEERARGTFLGVDGYGHALVALQDGAVGTYDAANVSIRPE